MSLPYYVRRCSPIQVQVGGGGGCSCASDSCTACQSEADATSGSYLDEMSPMMAEQQALCSNASEVWSLCISGTRFQLLKAPMRTCKCLCMCFHLFLCHGGGCVGGAGGGVSAPASECQFGGGFSLVFESTCAAPVTTCSSPENTVVPAAVAYCNQLCQTSSNYDVCYCPCTSMQW